MPIDKDTEKQPQVSMGMKILEMLQNPDKAAKSLASKGVDPAKLEAFLQKMHAGMGVGTPTPAPSIAPTASGANPQMLQTALSTLKPAQPATSGLADLLQPR